MEWSCGAILLMEEIQHQLIGIAFYIPGGARFFHQQYQTTFFEWRWYPWKGVEKSSKMESAKPFPPIQVFFFRYYRWMFQVLQMDVCLAEFPIVNLRQNKSAPLRIQKILSVWECIKSTAKQPKDDHKDHNPNAPCMAYLPTWMLDFYSKCRWISHTWIPRWWFQTFFIFPPTWGNDPIWLICFKWVETTN